MQKKYNVVILGAGSPFSGDVHSALRKIDTHGSVLDWQMHAIKPHAHTIQFVGGYQIDKIFKRHNDIVFINNQEWQTTGSVESLFQANLVRGIPLLVLYSDIIFWPEALQKILDQDVNEQIVVATDGSYPDRYARNNLTPPKSTEMIDGSELVGIFSFPPETVDLLIDTKESGDTSRFSKKHMSSLLEAMGQNGKTIHKIDIRNEWSDLNIPAAVAKFIMGSKAETLERLERKLTQAIICPQFRLKKSDFLNSADKISAEAASSFSDPLLAIRSSALCEDGFETANAGVFHSVLNVPKTPESIRGGIEQVLSSYPDDGMDHQVFIQPMVQNVCASGVIMTRSLNVGGPYITVNYTEGLETDKITGGTSDNDKVLTLSRTNPHVPESSPAWVRKLLSAVEEIESLLDFDALDIEFAVNEEQSIYILQIRPISLPNISQIDDAIIASCLNDSANYFEQKQGKAAGVVGNKAIFGIMPDWNPAEIIGIRPNALAATLYDFIITHDIWAKQRYEYGYRDLRSLPLMHLFCGQPYIDIRASLNSFTPADMPDSESEALIDFYIRWLLNHPYLHDKIEFDVVPTCYALDFDTKWRPRLLNDGNFPSDVVSRLETSLKKITLTAFERIDGDTAMMGAIIPHHERISSSPDTPLNKAMALLSACKEYGTLNFSHLARSAFVAVTLLKSLVSEGILSDARFQDYLLSMNTVSSQFAKDSNDVRTERMPYEDFVKKYGHLRPGTYDAASPSYRSLPDLYLKGSIKESLPEEKAPFQWTDEEASAMASALKQHGFSLSIEDFDRFCRKAIEGREFSKFIFTKSLSDSIEYLKEFGRQYNIGENEIVHIPLQEFQLMSIGYRSSGDMERHLSSVSEHYKSQFQITELIELPPLLTSDKDFFGFYHDETRANYVTRNVMSEDLIVLGGSYDSIPALKGKIVMIDSADPGYDWIFGHGIGGLITKFGGANSHMAIRCAEFGIPAAIGIGDVLYKKLMPVKKVEINCLQKLIRILS